MKWEYRHDTVAPGEDWYQMLRDRGQEGWEAWHIERTNGFRDVYFKRPVGK